MPTAPPTSLTLLGQLHDPRAADAWARFARLYTPLLVGWAKRSGFRDADAADLVQEVLVKLTAALPHYTRGEGQSFRGWLYRVARRTSLDFRRNRATRPLPHAAGLSDAAAPAPFAALEEHEYRAALVRRALELIRPELTETTWHAFHLHMIDGRPAADVAARIGVTPNAVYLARHRVLTRLRREVDGLLD